MVSPAHRSHVLALVVKLGTAGWIVLPPAGDEPTAQLPTHEGMDVTTRRKGPSRPSNKNRRTTTNQWRDAGEWLALILKVLAYLATLAVTLSGYGCGPS